MKYYKSQVKLGHLGSGKELPAWLYIKAKDMMSAISCAKKMPAIKHSQMPTIAIEITKDEYKSGIQSKEYYEKMDQIFGV